MNNPGLSLIALRTDTAWHETLGSCLAAGNAWAKKAPVLGFAVAKAAFSQNNHPNRVAVYDTGAAMMSLTIQAIEMDSHVHQMAGFDLNLARQVAGIPEGFDPVAMFALGHLGDPDSLNPDQKARELAPRTRKPRSELVFGSQWSHAVL
ncbi:MAG TPA: nitroreductase family protein [Bryobacteraceae bacterium]|nr:nitroreductase family protein [Bryobacteraceae bacterium]